MSRSRDYQKSKVYAWEQAVVQPRAAATNVSFDRAQAFVDGIFLCEGLIGPPHVELLPRQAKTIWADGCRGVIRIPSQGVPSWVLLHEIAHALTMDADYNGDRHGPDYVGCYIKLLDKYQDIPLALTMYTLHAHGIDFNFNAQPLFVDQRRRA